MPIINVVKISVWNKAKGFGFVEANQMDGDGDNIPCERQFGR
jgi:hypothetical protein